MLICGSLSFGVSIHVPARGTTYFHPFFSSCLSCFNPRSRKGNDRNQSFHTLEYILFQSTFPQGERHEGDLHYEVSMIVSIHVPARGTTTSHSRQHTRILRFNPRSRKGNDFCDALSQVSDCVSIHVPARGTTLISPAFLLNPLLFQSTFPQGERPVPS